MKKSEIQRVRIRGNGMLTQVIFYAPEKVSDKWKYDSDRKM